MGITLLQKENFEFALQLLKKAESKAQIAKKYRSITFNNLACFYRRIGKYRSAQIYLEKALASDLKGSSLGSLSDIYINLCVVLSQLGKHESALENIFMAIFILQDQMLELKLDASKKEEEGNEGKEGAVKEIPEKEEENEEEQNKPNEDGKEKENPPPTLSEDRFSALAMAHYNMAVELEHLNRLEEAINAYEKASNIVSTHIPSNTVLLSACQQGQDEACDKLEAVQNAQRMKKRGKEGSGLDKKGSQGKISVKTNLKPNSSRMYAP